MATGKPQNIRRGEIWNVNFDPQVGAEVKKVRPAVVMNIPSAGRLPLHIIVPITTEHTGFQNYLALLNEQGKQVNWVQSRQEGKIDEQESRLPSPELESL